MSWQIVPAILPGLLAAADGASPQRVVKAISGMEKLDIELKLARRAG